jgi:hypothetical protein
MNVLIIDIGGSSVKLWHTAHEEGRKLESGRQLTPEAMAESVNEAVADWNYEVIALGLPCRVSNGRVVEDPQNLGPGWISFNFASALNRPVRILNDAALQALGSYDGGRMLFLGLGTAVGSALVAERLILSLDLGRLPVGDRRVSEFLSKKGYAELGEKKWKAAVLEIVPALKSSVMADYVVLGGGNAKLLDELPDGVRSGHNRSVVDGGRKLWEELQFSDPALQGWTVL